MPRRNVSERSWLGANHIYNRAEGGRAVFRGDEDRAAFLEILGSRVSGAVVRPARFRKAPRILGVDISAYCLMRTHFHLIVWQDASGALSRLMRSVLQSYVRIYNDKYGLDGPLFAGPFRCNPIVDNRQLRWSAAYVHANHPSGPDYRFASHRAFVDDHQRPGWLAADRILEAFGSRDAYKTFMRDHATRAELNRRFFG